MNRFITFLSILIFSAANSIAQSYKHTGVWRGAVKTASGTEIPFNFELRDTAGTQQITILNGAERFKVPEVKTDGDSLFIRMPLFDSEFKAKFAGDGITGYWIRHLPQRNLVFEFRAAKGAPRFDTIQAPLYNIQGRWKAVFASGDTTVAEFKQIGTKLTGTFLTTTGDYRYLEGAVVADSLCLSCFDGGHAFLFKAKIKDGQTISGGQFFAGYSGTDQWIAFKDANAKLPDAYTLTALKPGYKKIAFTFTNLDGQKVSLSDECFKNKVVILQMMGSWCPNCMDETAYMVQFYKKYHDKGVEVIGLAYERSTDFTTSKNSLERLKKRFDIPYTILITGYTNDKSQPAKSLPMLANFMAFPTTIIIDKHGDVRKIHTGFSGPGTGDHYAEFINEFEKLNDDLLAEK